MNLYIPVAFAEGKIPERSAMGCYLIEFHFGALDAEP
jgi:hypothetical protein